MDSILSLPIAIINGIRDVLTSLFIPSEGYFQDRWMDIRSRFPFVDSISVTVDSVLDFFKETAFNEPPKINVHLNFANSDYNWGGEAVYIDMSWYEPYKPIVDAFLSAWIWITFIFRLWKRLPGIISGSGSDFQVVQDVYESRDYIKWSLHQRRK